MLESHNALVRPVFKTLSQNIAHIDEKTNLIN